MIRVKYNPITFLVEGYFPENVNYNKNKINKIDINTRFFAQIGSGLRIANESSLYLAGANPEELMENKFTRSIGFINNAWAGYGNNINHFQQAGGLNLRGYAGYLAPYLVPIV